MTPDQQQLSGRESEALGEALDRVWEAVAMLSSDRRVVYANRAAAQILRRGMGIALAQDARLMAVTAQARDAVTLALSKGISPSPVAVPRPGLPPLVLTLHPLPEALQGAFGAVALLFISDPDARPTDCTAALRSAFGLTRVEARLAQLLSEGSSLKEIAGTNHITYETVRTHLRRILGKTGARRQAELVRITHALR